MINEKTIAQWEHCAISNNRHDYVEVLRLARRYLALRDTGVKTEINGLWLADTDLDAAADRLLEGCSSQSQNGGCE